MPVTGLALNGAGSAHASALAAVLELAGYLALLPHLDVAEHAVSHAVALSLITAAAEGDTVEAVGDLDRRTRRLAYLSVTARVSGAIVARAQLVKSIVPSATPRPTGPPAAGRPPTRRGPTTARPATARPARGTTG